MRKKDSCMSEKEETQACTWVSYHAKEVKQSPLFGLSSRTSVPKPKQTISAGAGRPRSNIHRLLKRNFLHLDTIRHLKVLLYHFPYVLYNASDLPSLRKSKHKFLPFSNHNTPLHPKPKPNFPKYHNNQTAIRSTILNNSQ